jgi:hypothetical protein
MSIEDKREEGNFSTYLLKKENAIIFYIIALEQRSFPRIGKTFLMTYELRPAQ